MKAQPHVQDACTWCFAWDAWTNVIGHANTRSDLSKSATWRFVHSGLIACGQYWKLHFPVPMQLSWTMCLGLVNEMWVDGIWVTSGLTHWKVPIDSTAASHLLTQQRQRPSVEMAELKMEVTYIAEGSLEGFRPPANRGSEKFLMCYSTANRGLP